MKETLLLKIGKALDNDVVLNIPFISDYHLEIFRDIEGNVFMTDLNSMNGTFVNGNKLNGFIMLMPKDEVFLGSGFRFQWEQLLQNPKGGMNFSQQQTQSNSNGKRKYEDAYAPQIPPKKENKVQKPFFQEHLDLIIIYGLILVFVLYFYLKVN